MCDTSERRIRSTVVYKQKMQVACEDGVPRGPSGVTGLISPSNLHAMSTLSGQRRRQRMVLSDQVCVSALRKLGGLDLSAIDVRRVKCGLRKILKMNKTMLAVDHVVSTIAKLEAFWIRVC